MQNNIPKPYTKVYGPVKILLWALVLLCLYTTLSKTKPNRE